MVLTAEGKRQFSLGELRFVHYAFFDDGIDYDPVISSASLSQEQIATTRDQQIEATPVVEAVSGFHHDRLFSVTDGLNVKSFLFTAPQGQRYLARATFDPASSSGTLQVDQRRVQRTSALLDQSGRTIQSSKSVPEGFERFSTSRFTVDVGVSDFFPEFSQNGFLLTVLSSGSDGLQEILPKTDMSNDECFGPEIKLLIDEELRAGKK